MALYSRVNYRKSASPICLKMTVKTYTLVCSLTSHGGEIDKVRLEIKK